MREVDYTDERGRRYRVALPEGAADHEAAMGIPIGPPDVVDALDWSDEARTRLHNELHRRGLYRLVDVRHRPAEVQAALQAALRTDALAIMAQYEMLDSL